MVQGLAAQSGGALKIASQPGKGTTISLWFPCARREDIRTAQEKPVQTKADDRSRGSRILLVDDDPLVSMNTAYMLMDLGHQRTGSAIGSQCITGFGNRRTVRCRHHRLRHAGHDRARPCGKDQADAPEDADHHCDWLCRVAARRDAGVSTPKQALLATRAVRSSGPRFGFTGTYWLTNSTAVAGLNVRGIRYPGRIERTTAPGPPCWPSRTAFVLLMCRHCWPNASSAS